MPKPGWYVIQVRSGREQAMCDVIERTCYQRFFGWERRSSRSAMRGARGKKESTKRGDCVVPMDLVVERVATSRWWNAPSRAGG